jgi:hypothetical protein
MAEAQRKLREEPPVSKILQDRVRPDAELVGQVLDPDRTPDTVRYPDPKAPAALDDSGGADSIAEVEMARRTDAGRRQTAPSGAFAPGGILLWFIAVAAVALLLFAIASI